MMSGMGWCHRCGGQRHKYFVILSTDLDYLSSSQELMAQAETVGRLLHGLIKSTERRR